MPVPRAVLDSWWSDLEYADRAKAKAWHRDGGTDVLPERLVTSLQAANLLPATYPSSPAPKVPWLYEYVGSAGAELR